MQMANDNVDLKLIMNLINRISREVGLSSRSPRRPPAPAGMRYLTPSEVAARNAEKAAAQAKIASADAELRSEIIDDIGPGCIESCQFAANLTNTTAKMLAEGKKYGVL